VHTQFHIIVTPINHSAEDKLVYESYISVHGYSIQNSVAICLDGFESTDSCASVWGTFEKHVKSLTLISSDSYSVRVLYFDVVLFVQQWPSVRIYLWLYESCVWGFSFFSSGFTCCVRRAVSNMSTCQWNIAHHRHIDTSHPIILAPPKCQCLCTSWRGVTSQKTWVITVSCCCPICSKLDPTYSVI